MADVEALTPDIERFLEMWKEGSPAHYYVLLLGLSDFDLPHLLKSVEKGLSYQVFEHFVRNISLPANQVTELIDIPRRTLSRRKQKGRFLREESDRLLRASRIFGKVLELFEGDRSAATDWLTSKQVALGGAVPVQLARTELGAREVERLADRLEHGVFS